MSARLTVGLLFGGASVEHEVSVASARGVARGLDPGRFECIPIGVTGDGRWLPPEASRAILGGSEARVERPAGGGDDRLVVDPGGGGLLLLSGRDPARPVPLDVLFPVLHGWGGEDGRLQGAMDLAGIPCVGAGVLGSALGMDKAVAKTIFGARGLPVGPWIAFSHEDYRSAPAEIERRLASSLGFPVFVKPSNGGSSVGITKVGGPDGLEAAIDAAFDCDLKVIAEAAIDGQEVECAVLGNDRPEASIPGEIEPSREFYDYAAKYLDGTSRLRIPAAIPAATAETVRRIAVEAFLALDLAGMARVDFFVERPTGKVLLNEANTLPGFTGISMYPKLWEASGLPYPELLDRLVRLALDEASSVRKRATRLRA
ncbi:MAG: D-alanine--D-alanine ligase [Acidobacteriia bacterium]|nr:D-alanine--D-alanine ligase [Terriglobia bacterium]